jgi:hypothetical protein
VKSRFAAIALVVVSASIAHAQKDSILVYESTARTTAMFGQAVVKTRTLESKLGIREELVEQSGPAAVGAAEQAGMEFVQRPGSYRLSLASGDIYFVDPKAREYSVISADDSTQDTMAMKRLAENVSGNSHSDVDSLGSGGIVAGQPTSHWKIHEISRISMKAGNDSVITGSDMNIDIYFSTSIVRLAPCDLRAPRGYSVGDRHVPNTLELKRVAKGTMNAPGMAMPIEISMDVTKVSMQRLDPALFALPEGYKKVPMPGPRITIEDLR